MTKITNQQNIDASKENLVRIVLFFQFDFDNGSLYFWTGKGSLDVDGITYTGSGNALKYEPDVETTAVEARSVTYTLSGIDEALRSVALTEDYQGRKATCKIGFLNSDNKLIASPSTLNKGIMDVMGIEDNGDTLNITLTVESNLIGLTRTSERRRTDEDQKQKYPDDTFFNHIEPNSEIIWGSA